MRDFIPKKIKKDLSIYTSFVTNEQLYKKSKSIKYKIKNIIIKKLPYFLISNYKKCYSTLSLIRNYFYDFRRFYIYSSAIKMPNNKEKLRSKITINYHGIEKGLSLPQPRVGFGENVIKILIKQILVYHSLYGKDDTVENAVSSLIKYFEFNYNNDHHNVELFDEFSNILNAADLSSCKGGGVLSVTKDEIHRYSMVDLSNFFDSRHSVRQFSEKDVELEDIRSAIKMSLKTPSVCNRQSCKVHLFDKPEIVSTILQIQGGARGFEHEIKRVLIVTSDLSSFQSVGERYQTWIDGGLFAMSLVYALHSKGLGTCFLNWSKDHLTDSELKNNCEINHSETVIVVIAVGHLKDSFKVALSRRKNIDEVLVAHKSN